MIRNEASLTGYIQAIPGQPGFAILVFRTPEANRLVAQQFGVDGTVRDFAPIDPPAYVELPASANKIAPGDPALWAYILPSEAPCIGEREYVASWLASRLERIENPLLRLQAAEFCDLDRTARDAWRASFDRLCGTAPRSALAWRDVVVLPGSVRRAVAHAIASHNIKGDNRDLGRDVGIRVEAGKLHVSFDAELFEALERHPGALDGIADETRDVRDAFDLAAEIVTISREAIQEGRSTEAGPLLVAVGTAAIALTETAILGVQRRKRTDYSVPRRPPAMLEDLTRPPTLIASGTRVLYHGDTPPGGITAQLPAPSALPSKELALVLFTVVPGRTNVATNAAADARALQRAGYRAIGVVPHLPHPGLAEDSGYPKLLSRLQENFDAIYMLSDHSPYTRGGLAFGPSRSTMAISNRLRDLVANIDRYQMRVDTDTRAPEPGAALVRLIGSVTGTGRMTQVKLLDHALQRVTDFALEWRGAERLQLRFTGASPKARDEDLTRQLDREGVATLGVTVGGKLYAGVEPIDLSLEIDAAEWKPFTLQDFPDACARELQKHGWEVIGSKSEDAHWQIHQVGLEFLVECKAYGASVDGRPLRSRGRRRYGEIVMLTNASINANDFARMLLHGRMPVNYCRIGTLRTLVTRRYNYLLSALRKGNHERQLIEAAFSIFTDTVRTGRQPPGIDLVSHQRARTNREVDIELDLAASRAVLFVDAARIDLTMFIGEPNNPNFQHRATVILHAGGWEIRSGQLLVKEQPVA